MTSRGLLTVVEGIDGTGKSTQVRLLADALAGAGLDVIRSKEPTDGPWGQKIRASASSGRMAPEEELDAFVKDRREHVENLITPGLEAGKVVILDRYFYSSIAYQGARLGNVEEIAQHMSSFAPQPDVVFLIDIDPLVSLDRISGSRGEIPNKFEQVESLNAAREIFNQLAEEDPCIVKLDGNCSLESIHLTLLDWFVTDVLRKVTCYESQWCDVSTCSAAKSGRCDWYNIRESFADRLSSSYTSALIS
ncbi:MAG: dTMP kinase [Planctomycetaceae bacterium]|nr:dTMP kinase [Planctomycetaceae bacterium]MBP62362.1 dTMP kinase [Planctomycetaceae bacterium]